MVTLTAFITVLSFVSISQASYAITGVHNGVVSGGVQPARQNINDVHSNVYSWSVFIQGLTAMQADSQNEYLSYYQLAGIHGRPYTSWDNVHGDVNSAPWGGYCTHDSILFPTWHRPYLALYEQVVFSYVQKAAAAYVGHPNQNLFINAATKFRIPYWDWASNSSIPDFVNSVKVTIINPSGARVLVNNPLYNYTFHPLNDIDFPTSDGVLATKPATIRSSGANAALQSQNLKSQVYRLLTQPTNYSSFATQVTSGQSIEAIHGLVHICIGNYDGNQAHMVDLRYSAFDPIFWLHHANVDRLFALWQAIYPTIWLPATSVDGWGTYAIPPGTVETSSTGLPPFSRDSNSTLWTSDSTRSLASFGYTYPEINDKSQTAAQRSSSVIAAVNKLYKPSTGQFPKREIAKQRSWSVSITVNKFALDCTFVIHTFLGAPPLDAGTWGTAANLIGSMAVFVPSTQVKKPVGTMLTNSKFGLADALQKAGLKDMEARNIAPYLKKNLTWRVRKMDGTVVDPVQVSGLRISVHDELVTPAADDCELPKYDKPTGHPDITTGKAGGATS